MAAPRRQQLATQWPFTAAFINPSTGHWAAQTRTPLGLLAQEWSVCQVTRAKAESVNFMAPFTVLRRPDLGKRLARRLVRELSRDFSLEQLDFPLLERDISDSLAMPSAIKSITKATDVLDLAWICTPPSPGSGGHTTLFRMVH